MKAIIRLFFILLTLNAFSQTEYVNPSILRQDIYSIEIKGIIATKDEFKFAFTIENKSNDKFLVFDLSKIAISFSADEVYYPKNDEVVVVNPNSKERRVVKVVGNANYQTNTVNIEFPRMKINNELANFSMKQNLTTQASQSLKVGEYANLLVSNFTFKKEAWNAEMIISTNDFEGMLIIDFDKIKENVELPIEFKQDRLLDKTVFAQMPLTSNDKYKFKFNIADPASTLTNINLSQAFSFYSFRETDVPPITVKKVGYVASSNQTNDVNLCDNSKMIAGLPVKIVVFNPDGVCFKLASNGKQISKDFSSNVEFDVEYGTTVLTIALNNGNTFTHKIYPSANDVYMSYEIITRKGEWKLQRKFDLSGDARKAENTINKTENTIDKILEKPSKTVECKDQFYLSKEGIPTINNLTVIKITRDNVYYTDCSSYSTKIISKMSLLGIEYANGSYDKFDFNGNRPKANMDLVRSEKEVIELRNRNSSDNNSSIIIGPNKH